MSPRQSLEFQLTEARELWLSVQIGAPMMETGGARVRHQAHAPSNEISEGRKTEGGLKAVQSGSGNEVECRAKLDLALFWFQPRRKGVPSTGIRGGKRPPQKKKNMAREGAFWLKAQSPKRPKPACACLAAPYGILLDGARNGGDCLLLSA